MLMEADHVFVSDQPKCADKMTMYWTISPQGDGSCVSVEARDVPPGIKPKESLLANLARFIEGQSK